MKIEVHFEGTNTTVVYDVADPPKCKLSFLQQYRFTTAVLCDLKRKIQKTHNISPVDQQLTVLSSTKQISDSFFLSVFPRVKCLKRVREPGHTIQILGWCDDVHELKVDHNDTLLDVKFLLAEKMQTQPEYLQFVLNYSQRVLENNDPIAKSGLLSNAKCHYWLEIPSEEDPHNVVFRSLSKLMTSEPAEPTLGHFFRSRVQKFAKKGHLGVRKFNSDGTRGEYEFISFEDVGNRASNLASGIRSLGFSQGNETRIGICMANRPEWVMTDYACHTQGFVSIPLYDTLAKNAIEYIINHAGVSIAFCDVKTIGEVVAAKKLCPTLKYIVVCNDWPTDKEWLQRNADAGFTHRFTDLEALGANKRVSDAFPAPNDLATICYTSGTTGDPKGAMVTHKNIMSALTAFRLKLRHYVGEDDSAVSFLPLAHAYEKLMELFYLDFGVKIGYWRGDPLQLLEDIQMVKPTIFAGVPRLYQRFHDKILSQVNSANSIRQFLFKRALAAKSQAIKDGKPTPAYWDKLVFSKIRQAFGGRIRYAASGSAPLSTATVDFLRLIFADDLAEGYGLTETWATGTATQAEDRNTYGHVGNVGASVEIKLMNVDDMNYFTTDEPEPRGEVWIRGDSVFKGYYRNPEITKEVLGDNGWFATGDIGKWRLDGKLQIIDRKKNIFKLAQGEYIRPEYIEGVYKRSPYVGNIFVHGNSDQTYLVGIIYPDPEVFAKWAEQNGLKSIANNLDALIKEPGVKNAIEKDMEKIAKKEKLQGFEKVKKFVLTKDDFSVENGLLTSTMKLKRNVARTKFTKEIEQMYAEGEKSKSKL